MSSPALSPAPSPGQSPALGRTPPAREAGRKDPTLLHAHATMGSMLAHGVAPSPANYLIWYSYHSDATPGLRSAMDGRLAAAAAAGQRLTAACMEELHAQFFAAEREAGTLQEIATRLEGVVTEAVGLVQDAREDALRYGGTLNQASGRLAGEPQSLGALLRRLIAETLEVSRRSEAAARNLAETSRKTRELQSELAEARHLATTDPLTGLANRRQLDHALQEEAAAQKPFALLMVDLDHFKAVNDSHGHPAGDLVLRHVAGLLAEMTGAEALAARFGGEEFAVILPIGGLREVLAIAERLRAGIGASAIAIGPAGQRISVTASLGVAMAGRGEAPARLIERADAALYEAKRGGRNRVCSDPPLPKPESVWN
ncbi:GGDEF domain-containing protein [Sediminicoccus sp. KRV36]|uniref:GGDEF domain-containing protein n=1 Tax=Sediminicoccus sp. KRV36 TaxID=3133721 RepID=UPI00200E612D|nr:GGDEF domain-containing protein [Sediminicoccus rosea]UPY36437.1 GGDEF domain-containing protein [Sediminicoccus rosea]